MRPSHKVFISRLPSLTNSAPKMTKKAPPKKKEQYFALVTFDLRDVKINGKKDREVRKAVHTDLKTLQLDKAIVKRTKAPVKEIAYNTFTGLFPKDEWEPNELAKELRTQVKKSIKRQGIAGRVITTVSEPEHWASTSFQAPPPKAKKKAKSKSG